MHSMGADHGGSWPSLFLSFLLVLTVPDAGPHGRCDGRRGRRPEACREGTRGRSSGGGAAIAMGNWALGLRRAKW